MTRSEEDAVANAAAVEEALQNAERVIIVHVGTERILNAMRRVGLGYTVAWKIGGDVHVPWEGAYVASLPSASHVEIPYSAAAIAKLDGLMKSMMNAESLLVDMALASNPAEYLMAIPFAGGFASAPGLLSNEVPIITVEGGEGYPVDPPLDLAGKVAARKKPGRKPKAEPAPAPPAPPEVEEPTDAASAVALFKAQQAAGQATLPLDEEDDDEI